MFNVTWINKAAERYLGLRRSTSSGGISGGSFRNRPSISSTFQTRSRPTSFNPYERNDYALRFEALCRAPTGGRSVGSNIRRVRPVVENGRTPVDNCNRQNRFVKIQLVPVSDRFEITGVSGDRCRCQVVRLLPASSSARNPEELGAG